jgi:ABC-type multidrug transport system fused ATPase/permease subunit
LCEQGSHEELIENAGTYKRLWEAQMEMYVDAGKIITYN